MKKVLALILALAMTLGIVGIVNADDGIIKVEISVANNNTEDFPWQYDERDTMKPQGTTAQLEFIKNLLPGYEITIKPVYFENLDTQMPLLVAAGDQPDLCLFNKFEWMNYLDSGCFIEDLTDLMNEYGTNLLTILKDSLPYTHVGGQLKAIPCENFYYKYPTWLRMDWVRKLGFEEKDTYTLSEIKDILIAFTTQDPDGDGKDNTYGLGTRFSKDCQSWDVTFQTIFGAFGGQPSQTYLDKDTGVFSTFNYTQEFRDALVWLQELYAMKAIDQEAFILNYDQAMQNAILGRGGLYTGWWNSGEQLIQNGLWENQPEADLRSVFITSDDGTKAGTLDNGIVYKALMISNNAKYPEAVMKLCDYMFSTWQIEYSAEPFFYDGKPVPHLARNEDGSFKKIDENVIASANNVVYDQYYENCGYTMEDANADSKLLMDKFFSKGVAPEKADTYAMGMRSSCFNNMFYCVEQKAREVDFVLAYNRAQAADAEKLGKALPEKTQMQNKLNEIGRLIQINAEGHPVYQDAFYGLPPTNETIELKPAIDTFQKEWVVKFVTGEAEINDANWQTYLDTAVTTGAQAILDSQVKAYNDLNGTSYTAMNINGK